MTDADWFEAARGGLRNALEALAELPGTEWSHLESQLEPVSAERGAALLRAGERPDRIWHLHRGLVRLYYLTPDGREFVKGFGRAGELVAPLVSILRGEPAGFAIEVIEPVRAVGIPSSGLDALYRRHPCWDRIGRKLAEQALVRKEIREEEFLMYDARARYDRFLQRYGDLVGRIPQKQIAAYIGITEVALSRLLNRG